MWYAKNLPTWERVVRFAGALLMGMCAWEFRASPVGWMLGSFGLITVLTSVAGYCPMCGVAGRTPVAAAKVEERR